MTKRRPGMTLRTDIVEGLDGQPLAVHRLGAGRPVIALHGLFSDADTNWIKFGHARRLAEAGFEAIMPDLRAHGASAKPHDPSAYPRDVLVATWSRWSRRWGSAATTWSAFRSARAQPHAG